MYTDIVTNRPGSSFKISFVDGQIAALAGATQFVMSQTHSINQPIRRILIERFSIDFIAYDNTTGLRVELGRVLCYLNTINASEYWPLNTISSPSPTFLGQAIVIDTQNNIYWGVTDQGFGVQFSISISGKLSAALANNLKIDYMATVEGMYWLE